MFRFRNTGVSNKGQISGNSFRTPFSVDGGGNDPACIAGAFATREKAFQGYVLVAFLVAQDADGRGGSGFDPDHYRFVGQEAFGDFAEMAEAFTPGV